MIGEIVEGIFDLFTAWTGKGYWIMILFGLIAVILYVVFFR